MARQGGLLFLFIILKPALTTALLTGQASDTASATVPRAAKSNSSLNLGEFLSK